MNEPTQTGPHSGDLDLMIAWLGGRDEEKVEKATTILLRIGQPVVEYLVQAAMKSGRRPEHRVRILDLVQQLGQPLGVDEFFRLQQLLQDHSPAVRQKAEETLMALSAGGLPKSPEATALARAFNPAFWGPPRCPPRRTRNSNLKDFCRGALAAAKRLAKSKNGQRRRHA